MAAVPAGHPLQRLTTQHPGVDLLRLNCLFLSNIPGTRIISIRRALDIAAAGDHAGLSCHNGMTSCVVPGGAMTINLVRQGQEVWVPDWSTLRLSPLRGNQAEVICYLYSEDVGYDLCARSRCRKVVEDFQKKHQQEVKVGWEIEFHLLDPETHAPLNAGALPLFSGTIQHSKVAPVIEEAVRLLEAEDIPVWHASAENDRSQLEISLSPQPAIVAPDILVRAKALIKDVAQKHGMHATMAPQPFEGSFGSGLHMHLTISQPDTIIAFYFLGGVLQHMDEMTAVTLPQPASYSRTLVSKYAHWGDRIGYGPIRRVSTGHWEYRQPDATANPYLLLSSFLALGGAGIDNHIRVAVAPQTDSRLADSEEARKEHNVTQPLSRTLKDAVGVFKTSKILTEALGQKLHGMYCTTRLAEAEHADTVSAEEIRKRMVMVF